MAKRTALSGDTLSVAFAEPAHTRACTADHVPRATTLDVPSGVDPTRSLTVVVAGDGISGRATLDGVAGLSSGGSTDHTPSAGWTGKTGMFVLLTWGSSTCRPAIQDVAVTGAAEVTVQFVQPPSDQVCTMDMVQRALVVEVDGHITAGDARAILQGDGFDDVAVPIAGSN